MRSWMLPDLIGHGDDIILAVAEGVEAGGVGVGEVALAITDIICANDAPTHEGDSKRVVPAITSATTGANTIPTVRAWQAIMPFFIHRE